MTPELELLRKIRAYWMDGGAQLGPVWLLVREIDALLALPTTARSEPTENQVQQAAEILAMSPLIEAPKLTWHEWMGLARDILKIATAPLSETAPSGTAKVAEDKRGDFWKRCWEGRMVPEGWKRVAKAYLNHCEMHGFDPYEDRREDAKAILAAAPSPDNEESK